MRSPHTTTGDTTQHTFSSGSFFATDSLSNANNNSVKYLKIFDSKDMINSTACTDRDGYEIPNSTAALRPKGQLAGKRGGPVTISNGTGQDGCGQSGHSSTVCEQHRLSSKSARNCSPPPTYSQLFCQKPTDVGCDSHSSGSDNGGKGGYVGRTLVSTRLMSHQYIYVHCAGNARNELKRMKRGPNWFDSPALELMSPFPFPGSGHCTSFPI